jgi:hypothetical protein
MEDEQGAVATETSPLTKLVQLAEKVDGYFELAEREAPSSESSFYDWSRNRFSELTFETSEVAHGLRSALLGLTNPILKLIKDSLISSEADLHEARIALKSMEASIFLESFIFRGADVAHDEGEVLGFLRESQERAPCDPARAKQQFSDSLRRLRSLLEIAESASDPGRNNNAESIVGSYREALRIEPNQAFIIMGMDRKFDDARNVIKDVFHKFGIDARRADDIEHEQRITDKIIEQIKTCEFLFADLTSERPNVYYEVGYAHALGRRVILFCEKGARRHFDLADYNCREYEDLEQLKAMLVKRLEAITGKNPR